jgi:mRNA interferase MazF
MRRGDIYVVDFEPSQGAEAGKERPAVIVSNDWTQRKVEELNWGVINVVPVTSNVARTHRFQVHLPAEATGLDRDSRAQAEQIRAVTIGRLLTRVGRVPPPLMRQLDEALRIQLAL